MKLYASDCTKSHLVRFHSPLHPVCVSRPVYLWISVSWWISATNSHRRMQNIHWNSRWKKNNFIAMARSNESNYFLCVFFFARPASHLFSLCPSNLTSHYLSWWYLLDETILCRQFTPFVRKLNAIYQIIWLTLSPSRIVVSPLVHLLHTVLTMLSKSKRWSETKMKK